MKHSVLFPFRVDGEVQRGWGMRVPDASETVVISRALPASFSLIL